MLLYVCFSFLDCPSDIPHACNDKQLCFNDAQKCDTVKYCSDGSDEETSLCGMLATSNTSCNVILFFKTFQSDTFDIELMSKTSFWLCDRIELNKNILGVHCYGYKHKYINKMCIFKLVYV